MSHFLTKDHVRLLQILVLIAPCTVPSLRRDMHQRQAEALPQAPQLCNIVLSHYMLQAAVSAPAFSRPFTRSAGCHI
jgi:hypothetical protein